MLSVALIVKNEENHLKRCLDSISFLSDVDIVVVDTGSTDNTVAIAKDCGARVFHQPWQDDYALHRNHALKKCRNDWVLSIDADEELVFDRKVDPQAFCDFLKNLPHKIHTCAVTLRDWRESMKQYVGSSDPIRIFRRKHARWHRAVHEELVFSGDSAYFNGVHLKHYGYDITTVERQKKTIQKINLLNSYYRDHPQDSKCLFYLANANAFISEHDTAIKYAEDYFLASVSQTKKGLLFAKGFNASIFHIAISIAFGKKDIVEAEKWVRRGLDHSSKNPDVCWGLMNVGLAQRDRNKIAAGAQFYIQAFEEFNQNRFKIFANQPIFNLTADCYAIASYHCLIVALENADSHSKRLDKVLARCSPNLRESISNQRQKAIRALAKGSPQNNIIVAKNIPTTIQ